MKLSQLFRAAQFLTQFLTKFGKIVTLKLTQMEILLYSRLRQLIKNSPKY